MEDLHRNYSREKDESTQGWQRKENDWRAKEDGWRKKD